MSEENVGTDERPAADSPERLTEEERKQLWELKRKESADKKAAEEEAAAELAAEQAEFLEKAASRPLHYVLVRHMARSPRTRTMRAGRAGHRRQGVILDDGTRIKKKGRKRYTQIDLRTMVDGHHRLLEYVRIGTLEVLDPKNEQVIPYDSLVNGIKGLMTSMADGRDAELSEESMVPQDEIPGSDSDLNAAPSSAPEAGGADGEEPTPPVETAPPAEETADEEYEEEESVSEEEMLKMGLDDLKALAVENGADKKDVKKLRSKKDVVALIQASGGE